MERTACRAAIKTAAEIPANSPIQTFWVTLPTRAPTMEPISIMPSMAMFTTPARSLMMPEKAPRVMGTAMETALESMPPRLSDFPEACQVRKLKMSSRNTTPTIPLVALPNPLIVWKRPMPRLRIMVMSRAVWEGTTQLGIVPTVMPPGVITKVVRASVAVLLKNTKKIKTAVRISTTPMMMRRLGETSFSLTRAIAVEEVAIIYSLLLRQ
ncbi:hypothetical protein SDC9_101637 [bioreactor metagenome]|uniref:Uncharacterized protein n=1 Tax=bioreactor metagenome TaxID=1076179 RepID=A0A645AZA8_9ZZZZ